jgi:hypothetical protein
LELPWWWGHGRGSRLAPIGGRKHRRCRGEGRSIDMTYGGAGSDGPTIEEKVVLCASYLVASLRWKGVKKSTPD